MFKQQHGHDFYPILFMEMPRWAVKFEAGVEKQNSIRNFVVIDNALEVSNKW